MLISFIKKGVYGYLRDDQLGIHNFVSNNNLAVRKSAAEGVNGYRNELRIAEDYDLCQRIARAGQLLYFCPEVVLEHRARETLWGLLRQWWDYGFHLARNHSRYHPGKRFFAMRAPTWEDREAGEPIAEPVPTTEGTRPTLFVYLSPFVAVHVLALAAVLMPWGSTALTVLTVMAAMIYAYPDFSHLREDGLATAVGLFAVRYLTNITFVGAGLAGGLSRGSLYLLPAISIRLGSARGRRDDS